MVCIGELQFSSRLARPRPAADAKKDRNCIGIWNANFDVPGSVHGVPRGLCSFFHDERHSEKDIHIISQLTVQQDLGRRA